MAQITYSKQYSDAIQAIKQAILQSRYTAARLVNREMLALYYAVGEYISLNSRTNTWGTGALEFISQQLQQELPGLRGFSITSLKKMRTFFENWNSIFSNRPSTTDKATHRKDGDKEQQHDDDAYRFRHPVVEGIVFRVRGHGVRV